MTHPAHVRRGRWRQKWYRPTHDGSDVRIDLRAALCRLGRSQVFERRRHLPPLNVFGAIRIGFIDADFEAHIGLAGNPAIDAIAASGGQFDKQHAKLRRLFNVAPKRIIGITCLGGNADIDQATIIGRFAKNRVCQTTPTPHRLLSASILLTGNMNCLAMNGLAPGITTSVSTAPLRSAMARSPARSCTSARPHENQIRCPLPILR